LRVKYIAKIGLLFLLINSAFRISAQEIKVTEFRSNPRDISAREHTVYDANGDACAIIKTRTGLQNLKFSGDLEIRKIENHSGEYWLWVSPNTKMITIEAEGIGRLQYQLPAFTEEYNVYVIFLTAVLPDKILYKNINSVRVETSPKKAEVYIDKTFLGYSPLDINVSKDTFLYEIRKKKYISETGSFIYSEIQKELFVKLKKNPEENRMYFTTYCSGGNKYYTPFFGFETGMIGRAGWYISFVPPYMTRKYIATVGGYDFSTSLLVDNQKFLSIVGSSSEGYYIKLKDNNNTFYNQFRLKAGFTTRIFKNTFLKTGLGYASYNDWFRLSVIPYSNDPKQEIPLNKTFYGKREYVVNFFVFETGITYRILNHYLFCFNLSTTGFAHYFTNKTVDFLLPLEGSFGIGYNFN